MTFCSDIALASGEPLAGTTFCCRVLVFLPLEKSLWGEKPLDVAYQIPIFRRWIESAETLGLAVKVYDPRTGPFESDQIIICGPSGAGLVPQSLYPASIEEMATVAASANPVGEPLHFVCTHGQRERCCALYGFGIVKELNARRPSDIVLECSHLGGDRFAAVMFSAATGDMLGALRPSTVVDAITETLNGKPPIAYWRGSIFHSDLWAVAMVALRKSKIDARIEHLVVTKLTEGAVTGNVTMDGLAYILNAQLKTSSNIVQPKCIPATKRMNRVHYNLQKLRLKPEAKSNA